MSETGYSENRYSSQRFYDLLGERAGLEEEKKRIHEMREMSASARRSVEAEAPTRVHDLSEYENHLYDKEAIGELTADDEEQRRRFAEAERELERIPERLLSEEVLPEGLWVRYGDTGIRVDRDRSKQGSPAVLSEYPWEAVEETGGGGVARVAEASRLREMGVFRRFAHLHPSLVRGIRYGAPIAALSTVALGLLWTIAPPIWNALGAALEAISPPPAPERYQDAGGTSTVEAAARQMIRVFGICVFLMASLGSLIYMVRGYVASAFTLLLIGMMFLLFATNPEMLGDIGEWISSLMGIEVEHNQQSLPE